MTHCMLTIVTSTEVLLHLRLHGVAYSHFHTQSHAMVCGGVVLKGLYGKVQTFHLWKLVEWPTQKLCTACDMAARDTWMEGRLQAEGAFLLQIRFPHV